MDVQIMFRNIWNLIEIRVRRDYEKTVSNL